MIAVLTWRLVRATQRYVDLTKHLADAAIRTQSSTKFNLQGLVYGIVEDLRRLPTAAGMDCSSGNLPSEERMVEVLRLASYDERALINAAVAENHLAALRPRLGKVRAEPGADFDWHSWEEDVEIAIKALDEASQDEGEITKTQMELLEALDTITLPENQKEHLRRIIQGQGNPQLPGLKVSAAGTNRAPSE